MLGVGSQFWEALRPGTANKGVVVMQMSIPAFSLDDSLHSFRVHHLFRDEQGAPLQMQIPLRHVNVSQESVTSTQYSERLPGLQFLKNNRPQIILMLQRHASVGRQIPLPSPFRRCWVPRLLGKSGRRKLTHPQERPTANVAINNQWS